MKFKEIKASTIKKPGFFENEIWFQLISSLLFYKKEKTSRIYLCLEEKSSKNLRLLVNSFARLIPHSILVSNLNRKKKNIISTLKPKKATILWFRSNKKKNSFNLEIYNFPKGPFFFLGIENFDFWFSFQFIGNASRWSRPILTFDENFNKKPHLRLLKYVFSRVFSSKGRKKNSQAFLDHVIAFFEINSKIFFRVYQLKPLKNFPKKKKEKQIYNQLVEIGPRVTFSLLRIRTSFFKKDVLFDSFHL